MAGLTTDDFISMQNACLESITNTCVALDGLDMAQINGIEATDLVPAIRTALNAAQTALTIHRDMLAAILS